MRELLPNLATILCLTNVLCLVKVSGPRAIDILSLPTPDAQHALQQQNMRVSPSPRLHPNPTAWCSASMALGVPCCGAKRTSSPHRSPTHPPSAVLGVRCAQRVLLRHKAIRSHDPAPTSPQPPRPNMVLGVRCSGRVLMRRKEIKSLHPACIVLPQEIGWVLLIPEISLPSGFIAALLVVFGLALHLRRRRFARGPGRLKGRQA